MTGRVRSSCIRRRGGPEEPFAERLARMVETDWPWRGGLALGCGDVGALGTTFDSACVGCRVSGRSDIVFCDGSGSVAGGTRRREPQMVLVAGADGACRAGWMNTRSSRGVLCPLSPLGAVLRRQ